jgi:RNA-directed DNA polymerase
LGGGYHIGIIQEKNKNLFDLICSLENLFTAWDRFSVGKHLKPDVMTFEHRLEDRLFALREELASESYHHDPYKPFTIHDPKQRSIHKATVKDRVVHQALVNVIEPLFEKRFIFDSFSCRLGKGTHAAVDRLRTFLRQASSNNTRTVYALKCDIRKFFASVDHRILLSLIGRVIKDKRTIKLIEGIVGSFSMASAKGLPLGNLTSQLFANVYLHELDCFAKFNLREKYYIRYCDDFMILSESRGHLVELISRLGYFLDSRLSLGLHPKKVFIRSWLQGVDFLGYVLLSHATVIRTKTVRRMLKRATDENLPSYAGLCRHADAYDLERLLQTKALCSSKERLVGKNFSLNSAAFDEARKKWYH